MESHQDRHDAAADALAMQAHVLGHAGYGQAATALATELARRHGATRVCVGESESTGMRVVAISHGQGPPADRTVFRAVEAAMDEAVDQAATLVHPPLEDDRPRVRIAHEALARADGTAILSVPFQDPSGFLVTLCLAREDSRPFTRDEVLRVEAEMALLGPLLVLRRLADEPLTRRLRRGMAQGWIRLRQPGFNRIKGWVYGGIVILAILVLWPWPYHVVAPARVEGGIQRILAAPHDGFLQQVHVRPGDRVAKDQVLAELAREDLQLERQQWESELAQHINAYGAAMARADRERLGASMARMQEARARLELIDQQLARTRLTAPFDGVVTEGDLSQAIGAPVKEGQGLLTVAPAGQFRLVVEVDERDVAMLAVDQPGQVRLTAQPEDPVPFSVLRIGPVATLVGENNVFEVEGRLSGQAAALRPGLKGVARIEAGRRPLGWVVFHRLADWLRLMLWRWGW
ncbi:MAG: efflux RND transporter periplasmic adaptor subunit [Pseudomonadota bacterium]